MASGDSRRFEADDIDQKPDIGEVLRSDEVRGRTADELKAGVVGPDTTGEYGEKIMSWYRRSEVRPLLGRAAVAGTASSDHVDDAGGADELNESEMQAVRDYTAAGSRDVNAALFTGTIESVEQQSAFAHEFSAALSKLPRHEGTVLRGFDSADLARYEPGEVIVENGFVSTTTDADAEFGGAGLWVIESTNGRQIPESLASVKNESEVVFDHFTQFRVLAKFDVEVASSTRCLMYMEEIHDEADR